MIVRVRIFVCVYVSVRFQNELVAANTQSRTCLMRQWSCGRRQKQAADGSSTVAVLSQSSGIERPFSLP